MGEDFDLIGKIRQIENMFLNLFGKQESKNLIELAWENIKYEYIGKIDNTMQLTTRLVIEDLIIYCIAIDGISGYKKILKIKETSNLPITIKSYKELEKHYEKYINILREHLKKSKEGDAKLKI